MKKIVVIGGGTMGLDIAHTFARSGNQVIVREINEEFAAKAKDRLTATLEKLVAKDGSLYSAEEVYIGRF